MSQDDKIQDNHRTGLILSGGGARAAYQVGVLKAIAEILPRGTPNPFGILCGTSAGAINATVLATQAANFRLATRNMEHVWRNFSAEQVYRTDLLSILNCAYHWLGSLLFSKWHRGGPVALFDNTPLRKLLSNVIPFENIKLAIDEKLLYALSVTVSSYDSGKSTSFFEGAEHIENWQRARRIGQSTKLTVNHLLASSGIPTFFPAVKIGDGYYGDGAVRQLAPISPALHLGADRVMVIGVSDKAHKGELPLKSYPSIARIAGHLLNSIFLDSLEGDIERLERVNRTIECIPEQILKENNVDLRPIEVLVISPSKPLDEIAAKHVKELPRNVRFFMGRTGATEASGATFMSYLLFEKGFCRELIQLGYDDAKQKKDEILNFFNNA